VALPISAFSCFYLIDCRYAVAINSRQNLSTTMATAQTIVRLSKGLEITGFGFGQFQ